MADMGPGCPTHSDTPKHQLHLYNGMALTHVHPLAHIKHSLTFPYLWSFSTKWCAQVTALFRRIVV